MSIRMFAGELDGNLEPGHIDYRASAVRHSISQIFYERHCRYIDNRAKSMWRRARKAGWRVVRVRVAKEQRNIDGSIRS